MPWQVAQLAAKSFWPCVTLACEAAAAPSPEADAVKSV
jgi:hypothetical protein